MQWQREAHDLENPDKKAQRRALRYDPRVAAALNAWWDVTDADGSGAIDREEYLELSKSLYRVMIGDGDEDAAQRSAEDDWEEDCKGKDTMGAEDFRDAIFQCVEPLYKQPPVAFCRLHHAMKVHAHAYADCSSMLAG